MKLKNKRTGEIIDDGYVRETHDFQFDGQKHVLAVFRGNGHRPPERVSGAYKSLAELNEEWEDAPEEPKEYWYIADNGEIEKDTDDRGAYEERMKQIGNYFETKEEAEKAVKKLEAWKRLKDEGFRFTGYSRYDWNGDESPAVAFEYSDFDKMFDDRRVEADLDLLFGGEE